MQENVISEEQQPRVITGISHCERMRSLRLRLFTFTIHRRFSRVMTMSLANAAKRPRKANWTTDEILLLLRELQIDGQSLFTKNSISNTTKNKAAIWQRIASRISALGHAVRTSEDVRMKWKGLKRDIFEKDREARMTGGGPLRVKVIPFEEMIRDVIGQGSALFNGLEVSGCDTCITVPPSPTVETPTGPLSVSSVPSTESLQIMERSLPVDGQVTVGPESDPQPSCSYAVDGEATMPQEPLNDSAEASSPPSTAVGTKTRLLQKKRRRPTTTGTAAASSSAAEEDQWPVYKEFLLSETQKNKLKVEKLKKDLEESDLRQTYYKILIENARKGAVPSFPL